MNILYQIRQVIHRNAIITDVSSDDVRSQRKKCVFGTLIIIHKIIPELGAKSRAIELPAQEVNYACQSSRATTQKLKRVIFWV